MEETSALQDEIEDLEDILARPARVKKIIVTELEDVRRKYAEPRCTGSRSPCTYCEFRCACTHRDGEHERTINIKDDPFAE